MKAKFFTLALLLISVATFAQTKLVDEWPAMMKARNADAAAYLQTHTTPNMTFIAGHDGSLQNKDWMMSLFKGTKSQNTDITDLNIQQSGDLAVATGVSTITAVSNEGKTNTYKDAFTYTLRWIGGQWMFTNFQHTKIEYK